MDEVKGPLDIFQTIKLSLLIAIPIGLLASLILYFKSRNLDLQKKQAAELESMKEEFARIAQKKIQERDTLPAEKEIKPTLDVDEIRERIENERDEYNEFELVTPIEGLSESDIDKEDEEEKNET